MKIVTREAAARIAEIEAEREHAVYAYATLVKQAEKLINALQHPDAAFKAVVNTVRQSSADIVVDLATAIRATAHKLIRAEARIAELEVEREHAVYAYVSARIAELETALAMYRNPTHCKIDQQSPDEWPCPRCGEGPCKNIGSAP